jgi:hypothetical protein
MRCGRSEKNVVTELTPSSGSMLAALSKRIPFDIIGMPLTPLSFAGARRRAYRRCSPPIAVIRRRRSLVPGNCSGLTFAIGQFRVYNNPARGRCRPDIARWAAYLGVIQHASSDHHDVRPAQHVAEQWRPAFGAETAAHYVSAICRADVFIDLACESEAFGFEDRIDRRIARRQVLAVSAPTSARGNRQPIELEPDSPAKASAGNRLHHLEHPSLACAGKGKPMLATKTISSRKHPLRNVGSPPIPVIRRRTSGWSGQSESGHSHWPRTYQSIAVATVQNWRGIPMEPATTNLLR